MWTGLIFEKGGTAILEVDKSPSTTTGFFSKGITTLYTSTFPQLEGKLLLGKAGIVIGAGTRIEKSIAIRFAEVTAHLTLKGRFLIGSCVVIDGGLTNGIIRLSIDWITQR